METDKNELEKIRNKNPKTITIFTFTHFVIFASVLGPQFCNTLTKIHMYPSIINQSIIHLTSRLDKPSFKKMNKYIRVLQLKKR
jgi:hypothetical protein